MKFDLQLTIFAAACTSLAAFTGDKPFRLETLYRANGPMNHLKYNAADGNIFANITDQNASCEGAAQDYATFTLEGDQLYLYSTSSNKRQQVYGTNSNTSLAAVGYLTEGETPPDGSKLNGWEINSEFLTFNGDEFAGCYDGDSLTMYLNSIKVPPTKERCIFIAAWAIAEDKPISCQYTK